MRRRRRMMRRRSPAYQEDPLLLLPPARARLDVQGGVGRGRGGNSAAREVHVASGSYIRTGRAGANGRRDGR
eukprot:6267417-Pyramimonas_sp.AAC.1